MDHSMRSLLPKLDELLGQDSNLHQHVKKDIESLLKELKKMHTALQHLDDPAKVWTRGAIDLAHDIERVVGKFCARPSMPASHLKGLISKISFKLETAKARRQFASDIRKFKQLIEELVKKHNPDGRAVPRGVVSVGSTLLDFDPRNISADELVGLDGAVEELVKNIFVEDEGSTSNRQLKIASIVGSEGTGKTTLASLVYKRLTTRFDCGAFIQMSTTSDIEMILREMVLQINPATEVDLRRMNVLHIREAIREYLKDKRYFIVVGDISDKKSWDIIKSALIDNSNCSAVLTTSRRTDVAEYVGGVYNLVPLSNPYTEQLFHLRLFGPGNNCPPELLQLSEKFIEKCNGIPSTIVTTAGLLKDMTSEGWHEVLDNFKDYVLSNKSFNDYAFFEVVDNLLGFDGPVEKLVKSLIEEGTERKVASIVGPPGVGKTALAKQVYRRLKKDKLFQCTALVTAVSTEAGIKRILSSILRQIGQQDHDNLETTDLKMYIDDIREALSDKRYLILLDDIRDIHAWHIMDCALIKNGNGSAVLTTSRITDITRDVGVTRSVHTLSPLAEIDSRKLFHRRIFGSEDKCPPEFAGISEKILRKCDCIPLAIISTARFLADKGIEEWDKVYQSNDYGIETNSNGIRSILALSYTGLPPHLRKCLLYLSLFQKGNKISVDRLIWGWIAEGFIVQQDGTTLQEVGEDYLTELINRNLIVPMDTGVSGKAISFRVYDMVQEMIISLSTKKSFLISDGQTGRFEPATVERLSIQGSYPLQPQLELSPSSEKKQLELSHIRSLVVSGDANLMPPLSEFKKVRVLDLGGCTGFLQDDHLKGIESSFFLKYLVIGGKYITAIPKEIGALPFLQTLDLRETRVKELPESIVQARDLKCLRVNSQTKIPYGIGKMKGLEELGDINISNAELAKELRSLTNLMVLGISIWSWDDSYNYDEMLDYLSSLATLGRNIRSISISTCRSPHFLEDLDAGWAPPSLKKLEIKESPFLALGGEWISSLVDLCSLSIEVQKLSQVIIDMLGKLPSLCSLSLTSKHGLEGEGRFGIDGFGNLSGFHLVSNTMGNLFESGTLPMLERCMLNFEASRTKDVSPEFDFGLGNLPSSLQHLRVEISCFNASLRMVEEAEAAIRKQTDELKGHSGQPILEIHRAQEDYMVENEREEVEDVKEAVRRKWTS